MSTTILSAYFLHSWLWNSPLHHICPILISSTFSLLFNKLAKGYLLHNLFSCEPLQPLSLYHIMAKPLHREPSHKNHMMAPICYNSPIYHKIYSIAVRTKLGFNEYLIFGTLKGTTTFYLPTITNAGHLKALSWLLFPFKVRCHDAILYT